MTERQVLDARAPQQWEAWLEQNRDAADEICAAAQQERTGARHVVRRGGGDRPLLRLDRRPGASYDDTSRIQRFSPRKPRSAWSKSNVERVQRLVDAGRMRQAGQRVIDPAKTDGRWPTS
jgi:uncharacterized protein YdeI (YjbR/CyaY-like superfamily)